MIWSITFISPQTGRFKKWRHRLTPGTFFRSYWTEVATRFRHNVWQRFWHTSVPRGLVVSPMLSASAVAVEPCISVSYGDAVRKSLDLGQPVDVASRVDADSREHLMPPTTDWCWPSARANTWFSTRRRLTVKFSVTLTLLLYDHLSIECPQMLNERCIYTRHKHTTFPRIRLRVSRTSVRSTNYVCTKMFLEISSFVLQIWTWTWTWI